MSTIVLVDDNEDIRTIFSLVLSRNGHTVHSAPGGRECIELLKTVAPDIILLDIVMPGMDGFQVLARLRAEDIELQIIILSAVSQREAVMRAFQAGVRSYLIKPLKPDQILKKTLEILKANF